MAISKEFAEEHRRLLTDKLVVQIRELEHAVSDRERAETRFRAVVESAPNAMVMIDAAGKIALHFFSGGVLTFADRRRAFV